MTTVEHPAQDAAWYNLSAEDAATRMGVDPEQGLATDEVQRRLAQYGPNELPTEPPPSMWVVARGQLANPMNIMLLIVCVGQLRHRAGGDRASWCSGWSRSTWSWARARS